MIQEDANLFIIARYANRAIGFDVVQQIFELKVIDFLTAANTRSLLYGLVKVPH